MPQSSIYTYNISSFSNGLNIEKFYKEITNSSFNKKLNGIDYDDNNITLYIKEGLNNDEQTELTNIKNNHTNYSYRYLTDKCFNVNIIDSSISTKQNSVTGSFIFDGSFFSKITCVKILSKVSKGYATSNRKVYKTL